MAGLLSGMFPHLFGGQGGAAPTNIVPADYPSPGAMSPVNMGLGGLLSGGMFGIHPNQAMLGMGMGMMNGQGWGQGIGQGLQMAGQMQAQQRQAAMNAQLAQLLRSRMLSGMGTPQPSPTTTLPGVY